ncbi:MAG: sugar phosphate isomerase/epimerase family protein [Acutalibacteraceae bacterium]|nr:sugar phosphate isomerase/epimerase family protein [Acutalibacteraceae bacterium]
MEYSVSTASLVINKETAEKNFPLLKKAGFSAIDLNFDSIFFSTGGSAYAKQGKPWCNSSFFDLSDEEFFDVLKGIKEQAEKNKVKIGQCHAPFPSRVLGREDGVNEYMQKCIKRSIMAAGYLNCPYIVVHPINAPYGSTLTKKEIFDMNVEFYSGFIDDLKKYNVVCCLENMWVQYKNKIFASTCNDFEEVNEYISVLNKKAEKEIFGFCLDTGHMVLTSGNIRFAIRTLGENLKVLHLHEVDGIKDNHTMPFTLGAVDWELIMTELNSSGYKGNLNFEAANSWMMFPKPLWDDAVIMLGKICRYFEDTYFN